VEKITVHVKFLPAATRRPLILKENVSETLFRELIAAFKKNESSHDSKNTPKAACVLGNCSERRLYSWKLFSKATCVPGNCSGNYLWDEHLRKSASDREEKPEQKFRCRFQNNL
jgi:hypothetical protein